MENVNNIHKDNILRKLLRRHFTSRTVHDSICSACFELIVKMASQLIGNVMYKNQVLDKTGHPLISKDKQSTSKCKSSIVCTRALLLHCNCVRATSFDPCCLLRPCIRASMPDDSSSFKHVSMLVEWPPNLTRLYPMFEVLYVYSLFIWLISYQRWDEYIGFLYAFSEKQRHTCSQINAASFDATSSSFISSSVVYVVNGNETELADVITTPSVAARREENTQTGWTHYVGHKLT